MDAADKEKAKKKKEKGKKKKKQKLSEREEFLEGRDEEGPTEVVLDI